ncbi:MAG: septum formation protein Maf [Chlorobi bacterium]|nr:septum formation protein Maf [Chlorobiota bacterium]
MDWQKNYSIILASKSPRRQKLLKDIGFDFVIKTFDVDEQFPDFLTTTEIPVWLAEKKAFPFEGILKENELVITADTIVHLDGEVLGKPENEEHAFHILKKLSNRKHQVVTGVCLKRKLVQKSFFSVTDVVFKELTEEEINYYIKKFHPFDKAGAYGIQEWIGFIGIQRINGCFFNVMGLPIQRLYEEIQKF